MNSTTLFNSAKVFIILLGLSCAFSGFAQNNKFLIGIEGGPGITQLYGNTLIKKYQDPTLSYAGGISFQYNLSEKISLRTNLFIEKKGSVMNANATDLFGNQLGSFKVHTNFNYLTLPVLLRYTFGQKIHFTADAGPFVGYLLSQNTTGAPVQASPPKDPELYHSFDFGVSAGFGFQLPFGEKYLLSCAVRNNLGLYNTSVAPVINNGTIKTNSTNLLFGIARKFGTATK